MADPLVAPQGVSIRVLDFFQRQQAKRDANGNDTGEVTVSDWVRYSPPGQFDRSVIEDKVSRLALINSDAVDNPAYRAARERWDVIKPLYDNWKQGNEIPVDGIPLAAANFIRREHAEMMKKQGIRTIEELLALPDSGAQRLGIPGMREIRAQAKRFMEAQDQNKVAASIAARDNEISNLKAEMDEMRAALSSRVAPAKRSPGRPKKQVDEEFDPNPVEEDA